MTIGDPIVQDMLSTMKYYVEKHDYLNAIKVGDLLNKVFRDIREEELGHELPDDWPFNSEIDNTGYLRATHELLNDIENLDLKTFSREMRCKIGEKLARTIDEDLRLANIPKEEKALLRKPFDFTEGGE